MFGKNPSFDRSLKEKLSENLEDSSSIYLNTLPETNIAHENPIFPCKYHQNGGFSMAMLVSGRVVKFYAAKKPGISRNPSLHVENPFMSKKIDVATCCNGPSNLRRRHMTSLLTTCRDVVKNPWGWKNVKNKWWCSFKTPYLLSRNHTPPEKLTYPPENWWLEGDIFFLKTGPFSGDEFVHVHICSWPSLEKALMRRSFGRCGLVLWWNLMPFVGRKHPLFIMLATKGGLKNAYSINSNYRSLLFIENNRFHPRFVNHGSIPPLLMLGYLSLQPRFNSSEVQLRPNRGSEMDPLKWLKPTNRQTWQYKNIVFFAACGLACGMFTKNSNPIAICHWISF